MKYIKLIAICLMASPIMGIAQNKQTSDFEILDSNQDGLINPYEALDVLLMMSENNKKDIRLKDISKLAVKISAVRQMTFCCLTPNRFWAMVKASDEISKTSILA